MNVVLSKDTNSHGTITIQIAKADYTSAVEKQVKESAKRANIKGFRPGKVPASLIQKLYGKSILIDEINKILSDTMSNYIRDNKLAIVGDPMPDLEKANLIDWDHADDLSFDYEVGMASDFDVDLAALPAIKSYEIVATDKDINDTITDLRSRFEEQIHPETVEANDIVFGTLAQGESSQELAIPTKAITAEAMALFTGKAKDEVITFDIQSLFTELRSLELATSKDTAEVTAMTGDYAFTISDITRSAAAEIDQAFFDKVLGPEKASNEAEFRTQLTEIIQDNYKREAEFLLQDDIVKILRDTTPIELPDDFLKRWLLDTQEGKFTAEEIDKDYDKFALDLRWTLIKNKVAENADIKVDYTELLEKTKAMFRSQFGSMGGMNMDEYMEGMIDKMAVNYLTDKEKKGNMQNIFNRVYADKVMAHIQQNISVETIAVDIDEFKRVANVVEDEEA